MHEMSVRSIMLPLAWWALTMSAGWDSPGQSVLRRPAIHGSAHGLTVPNVVCAAYSGDHRHCRTMEARIGGLFSMGMSVC